MEEVLQTSSSGFPLLLGEGLHRHQPCTLRLAGVGNSGLIHGYDPTRDRGDVDVAVMRNINPSMLEFYYLFVSNNY